MTRTRPHCTTCTCANEDLGEFCIYPPHEGFYGRCGTCDEIRWQVEYDEFDTETRKPARTTHCGCCTHRHNLSNGGHDARCLVDERNCLLYGLDIPSTVAYPGIQ